MKILFKFKVALVVLFILLGVFMIFFMKSNHSKGGQLLWSLKVDQINDMTLKVKGGGLKIPIKSIYEKELFVKAIKSASRYSPSHDTSTSGGIIKISVLNQGTFNIQFWMKPNDKERVYFYLINTDGVSLGSYQSVKLKEWIENIKKAKLKIQPDRIMMKNPARQNSD